MLVCWRFVARGDAAAFPARAQALHWGGTYVCMCVDGKAAGLLLVARLWDLTCMSDVTQVQDSREPGVRHSSPSPFSPSHFWVHHLLAPNSFLRWIWVQGKISRAKRNHSENWQFDGVWWRFWRWSLEKSCGKGPSSPGWLQSLWRPHLQKNTSAILF